MLERPPLSPEADVVQLYTKHAVWPGGASESPSWASLAQCEVYICTPTSAITLHPEASAVYLLKVLGVTLAFRTRNCKRAFSASHLLDG